MADIDTLFDELGEEQLRLLVHHFYLQVKDDDLIGPMYPDDDWPGAEKRLYQFLAMRFGGPTDYLEQRGHPRLRMRHFPFSIGAKEADRWVALMDTAMEESQLRADLRESLHQFFHQVAHFLRNRSHP